MLILNNLFIVHTSLISIILWNNVIMRSNNYLMDQPPLTLAVQTLQRFVKRLCLKEILHFHSCESARLFKFTGRANHRETKWLLRADRYIPDERKVPIVEDEEVRAKSNQTESAVKCAVVRRIAERRSVKNIASVGPIKRSMMRGTSEIPITVTDKTLAPLAYSQSKSQSDSEEDSEVVSNFRQQKTRRQEFKSRFLQHQRRQIFKLIDKTLTGLFVNPDKRLKREKLQQIDHFINVEASLRQPQAETEKLKKVAQKTYKNKSSKTQRKGKASVLPAHLIKDKHDELKLQQRVYLLNVPNEIKLNTGVTFREAQKHGHSMDNPVGTANRKKLQFLKNEEIKPSRIKISELMSYKKITTMNNLAYCSSMKTVKELPKDGTDSKISIDSRQFMEEPSGSKKLIKIANRKIYEQMLADFGEECGDVDMSFKKVKLKHKKEGKVRFDNVGLA